MKPAESHWASSIYRVTKTLWETGRRLPLQQAKVRVRKYDFYQRSINDTDALTFNTKQNSMYCIPKTVKLQILKWICHDSLFSYIDGGHWCRFPCARAAFSCSRTNSGFTDHTECWKNYLQTTKKNQPKNDKKMKEQLIFSNRERLLTL